MTDPAPTPAAVESARRWPPHTLTTREDAVRRGYARTGFQLGTRWLARRLPDLDQIAGVIAGANDRIDPNRRDMRAAKAVHELLRGLTDE